VSCGKNWEEGYIDETRYGGSLTPKEGTTLQLVKGMKRVDGYNKEGRRKGRRGVRGGD